MALLPFFLLCLASLISAEGAGNGNTLKIRIGQICTEADICFGMDSGENVFSSGVNTTDSSEVTDSPNLNIDFGCNELTSDCNITDNATHPVLSLTITQRSTCSESGICTCLQGFVTNLIYQDCLPIINLGEECVESQQCQMGTPGYGSICETIPWGSKGPKVCQCLGGWTNEPEDNKCYPQPDRIQKGCQVQAQCVKHFGASQCLNGNCQPLVNPAIIVKTTVKPKNSTLILIGSACTPNDTCSGNDDKGHRAQCTNSQICACLPGFIVSSTLEDCLPIVNKLGKECRQSQQCQQGVPGIWSECGEGRPGGGKLCKCGTNALNELGQHVCYKGATGIGYKCEKDLQCFPSLGLSWCNEGRCLCFERTHGAKKCTI